VTIEAATIFENIVAQQGQSAEVSALLSGGGKSIPLFKVFMPETVIAPVTEVMMSGYIGQGPKVDQFEKGLAPRLGRDNVVTLNSGTSALHLALRLAEAGSGDEVISTPMTCTATNVPILERGAKIVWSDIDPMTGNIDPDRVRKQITSKTKAIMAVHWGGYPCELEELNKIADEHGISVIEDAAHAFGSTYRGAPIGSHSNFVCFSFQAIKHMTTIDGGALTSAASESYSRAKLLRWYGIDRESPRKDFRCEEDVAEFGYKFHMNDVCATVGIEQLKYIDALVVRHMDNARFYRERFAGLHGLQLLDYQDDRESAAWLFTMRVKNRLGFMKSMQDAGITTSQVHARNDLHTMFKDSLRTDLHGVDAFTEDQVSIPVGWWLSSEQREHIAQTVERICG